MGSCLPALLCRGSGILYSNYKRVETERRPACELNVPEALCAKGLSRPVPDGGSLTLHTGSRSRQRRVPPGPWAGADAGALDTHRSGQCSTFLGPGPSADGN